MSLKSNLRTVLRRKRLSLSFERRQEAKERACKKLYLDLEAFNRILSFCPLSEEIDISSLNIQLAEEGRLILPVCESNGALSPYLVSHLKKDIQTNTNTGVCEPIKQRCTEIPLDQLDVILVPGLGFYSDGHRLGFGMGCYDRLLKQISCPTYGVGFREQLLKEKLIVEEHDVALTEVFLF